MNSNPVHVRGTIKPDGSLELEEKLSLPPGHVQVSVLPDEPRPSADWWQYLQRSRADLESSGARFREGGAIDDHIEHLRGDTEPVEAHYWESEWRKHHGEAPPC